MCGFCYNTADWREGSDFVYHCCGCDGRRSCTGGSRQRELGSAARFDDVCIRLFGRKEAIEPLLAGETYDSARLEVLDAREEISNDEAPMLAVRHKKDASLVRAALDVREGNADALISAGSTGAILACGMLRIGRINGIDRPALAAVVPTTASVPAVLLDAGRKRRLPPGISRALCADGRHLRATGARH